MRVAEITATKAAIESVIPTVLSTDISSQIPGEFRLLGREPFRRILMRRIAAPALSVQRGGLKRLLGFWPSFHTDLVSLGDRFAGDASAAALLHAMPPEGAKRVLIPGCYLGGEDVQFWLRRGVDRLDGIDLNCLATRWDSIVPQLRGKYGAEVHFQQAPLESLPFADESFDVIATSGVLEHIQNISAVCAETARVLKPEGLAWHGFGPLYFSYGADHCIAAYGQECGYDHLLLPESEYHARISDQAFYDRLPDPNLPYWARNNQFSFARASEYLEWFRKYFKVRHVVSIITREGLAFRDKFPRKWRRLLDAGIAEEDLLIKGLCVVLQKP